MISCIESTREVVFFNMDLNFEKKKYKWKVKLPYGKGRNDKSAKSLI
jgi:hypothetical protein